jgi:hypothetical protein
MTPNKPMQRSGNHKVPGRGRSMFSHLQVRFARVLMGQRAVADGCRYATMRSLVALIACALLCSTVGHATQPNPAIPLTSGVYTFQHRDAEFPSSPGFPVQVSIQGNKVTIINPKPYGSIPSGVIEDATLMWHAQSAQWILAHADTDRHLPEVGGCTGGPSVIDFKARIVWTCEGGP